MLKSILSAAFWPDVLSVVIAIVVGDLIVAWSRPSCAGEDGTSHKEKTSMSLAVRYKLFWAACIAALCGLAFWKNSKSYPGKSKLWRLGKSAIDTGFGAADGPVRTSPASDVRSDTLKNFSHNDDNVPANSNSNSDFELSAGRCCASCWAATAKLIRMPDFLFQTQNNVDNSSQLGFWLGCGYFFHVVHIGILTFSLGPDLGFNFYLPPSNSGSDYSKFMITAGVPLNFDFDFFQKYSIRISASAFDIGYLHVAEATDVSENTFDYSLQSILAPSFTFFYTF